jgi:hypothetical protein
MDAAPRPLPFKPDELIDLSRKLIVSHDHRERGVRGGGDALLLDVPGRRLREGGVDHSRHAVARPRATSSRSHGPRKGEGRQRESSPASRVDDVTVRLDHYFRSYWKSSNAVTLSAFVQTPTPPSPVM